MSFRMGASAVRVLPLAVNWPGDDGLFDHPVGAQQSPGSGLRAGPATEGSSVGN